MLHHRGMPRTLHTLATTWIDRLEPLNSTEVTSHERNKTGMEWVNNQTHQHQTQRSRHQNSLDQIQFIAGCRTSTSNKSSPVTQNSRFFKAHRATFLHSYHLRCAFLQKAHPLESEARDLASTHSRRRWSSYAQIMCSLIRARKCNLSVLYLTDWRVTRALTALHVCVLNRLGIFVCDTTT